MSILSEICAIAIKKKTKRQNLTKDFPYLLVPKPDKFLQSSSPSPEADHIQLFLTCAQHESYALGSECYCYNQKIVCLFPPP